jgi:hypothetical protein
VRSGSGAAWTSAPPSNSGATAEHSMIPGAWDAVCGRGPVGRASVQHGRRSRSRGTHECEPTDWRESESSAAEAKGPVSSASSRCTVLQ